MPGWSVGTDASETSAAISFKAHFAKRMHVAKAIEKCWLTVKNYESLLR